MKKVALGAAFLNVQGGGLFLGGPELFRGYLGADYLLSLAPPIVLILCLSGLNIDLYFQKFSPAASYLLNILKILKYFVLNWL